MFCKLPYSNERENYSGFSSGFFSTIAGSRVNIIDNAPLGHYAVVGAAAGGTAEALGGGKFANGAVTGAFVGMFNHGWHAQKKQKSFKSKVLAVYLNSVEMIGGQVNPFKDAVAISVDGGWSLVGAEGDSGYFFVLTGEDAGNFYSFSEITGGGGTDLGLNGEIARIDFSGDPSDFKADILYGERHKFWGGVG